MIRTGWRGLAAWAIAAMLALAASADGDQHITDERVQLIALHAIFLGMDVKADRGTQIDYSVTMQTAGGKRSFPDALVGATVYGVSGKAMNEAEECASGDVITPRFSTKRRVRMALFAWPNEGESGLLAVLQYDFPDAKPPMVCPSLGLLAHVVRENGTWAVKERYLLETVHHHGIQGIRMMDLTGRGVHELVIESGYGGAGTAVTSLQVFDLSKGRFDEVLTTDSWTQEFDTEFTQVLDVARTRARGGRQFCLLKTTYREGGKTFRPARVAHPCYWSR